MDWTKPPGWNNCQCSRDMVEIVQHPASDHAAYLAKWNLSNPVLLADTPTGMVWKVHQQNDEPAVLKLLKPLGLPQEFDGANYLQWRNGNGCAKLLRREHTVFLIEYVSDYTLRDHLIATSDKEATAIICEVITNVHKPVAGGPPKNLPHLREYCEGLFRKAKVDRAAGSSGLIVKAADLLENLILEQKEIRPLHGDIHHRNIMLSPTRGWLAIDPGSLMADPTFEIANMFFNPDDMEAMVEDLARIQYLAETFSSLLNRPAKTVLHYGFVYACLSASWAEEDGRDPASRLRVAELMNGML